MDTFRKFVVNLFIKKAFLSYSIRFRALEVHIFSFLPLDRSTIPAFLYEFNDHSFLSLSSKSGIQGPKRWKKKLQKKNLLTGPGFKPPTSCTTTSALDRSTVVVPPKALMIDIWWNFLFFLLNHHYELCSVFDVTLSQMMDQ